MHTEHARVSQLNGCQGSQYCLGSACSQGDWAMMTRAQEDDLDELRNGPQSLVSEGLSRLSARVQVVIWASASAGPKLIC